MRRNCRSVSRAPTPGRPCRCRPSRAAAPFRPGSRLAPTLALGRGCPRRYPSHLRALRRAGRRPARTSDDAPAPSSRRRPALGGPRTATAAAACGARRLDRRRGLPPLHADACRSSGSTASWVDVMGEAAGQRPALGAGPRLHLRPGRVARDRLFQRHLPHAHAAPPARRLPALRGLRGSGRAARPPRQAPPWLTGSSPPCRPAPPTACSWSCRSAPVLLRLSPARAGRGAALAGAAAVAVGMVGLAKMSFPLAALPAVPRSPTRRGAAAPPRPRPGRWPALLGFLAADALYGQGLADLPLVPAGAGGGGRGLRRGDGGRRRPGRAARLSPGLGRPGRRGRGRPAGIAPAAPGGERPGRTGRTGRAGARPRLAAAGPAQGGLRPPGRAHADRLVRPGARRGARRPRAVPARPRPGRPARGGGGGRAARPGARRAGRDRRGRRPRRRGPLRRARALPRRAGRAARRGPRPRARPRRLRGSAPRRDVGPLAPARRDLAAAAAARRRRRDPVPAGPSAGRRPRLPAAAELPAIFDLHARSGRHEPRLPRRAAGAGLGAVRPGGPRRPGRPGRPPRRPVRGRPLPQPHRGRPVARPAAAVPAGAPHRRPAGAAPPRRPAPFALGRRGGARSGSTRWSVAPVGGGVRAVRRRRGGAPDAARPPRGLPVQAAGPDAWT